MCGIVVIYGLELLCVVYCYIFLRFLHETQENVLFITHNILSCLCTWFSFDVSLDYILKTYQGRKRRVKVDPWENHHPNLFLPNIEPSYISVSILKTKKGIGKKQKKNLIDLYLTLLLITLILVESFDCTEENIYKLVYRYTNH